MPILALGVSYRRAPVELLERLSFGEADVPKAYRQLLDEDAVREGAILSTCNRVEVYANVETYHAGFQGLKRFLAESREVPFEEFAEPLYAHYEGHAVEHLFSVASGIDSVVIGELQILAQVRAAFRSAQDERATGPVLSALFRGAIRAGRRGRAETEIASSPAGFVEAGLDLAENALGALAGVPGLLVGAGAMGSIAVEAMHRRGLDPIAIVGRSPSRASRLARRNGDRAVRIDHLPSELARGGVVVSATAATGTVIGADAVRGGPRPRPLFVLDLAVPRDVDPDVAALPGVTVVDLDDLKHHLAESRRALDAEVEAVRRIVAEEVARFESWRAAGRMAPLIQALQERGEAAVAAELRRLAPRLSSMSERDAEAAVALARGTVAKLLHEPIVRLKTLSAPGTGERAAAALAELFGIEAAPRE